MEQDELRNSFSGHEFFIYYCKHTKTPCFPSMTMCRSLSDAGVTIEGLGILLKKMEAHKQIKWSSPYEVFFPH